MRAGPELLEALHRSPRAVVVVAITNARQCGRETHGQDDGEHGGDPTPLSRHRYVAEPMARHLTLKEPSHALCDTACAARDGDCGGSDADSRRQGR